MSDRGHKIQKSNCTTNCVRIFTKSYQNLQSHRKELSAQEASLLQRTNLYCLNFPKGFSFRACLLRWTSTAVLLAPVVISR